MTKTYATFPTIRIAVEADSRDEAERLIGELFHGIRHELPTGARFQEGWEHALGTIERI